LLPLRRREVGRTKLGAFNTLLQRESKKEVETFGVTCGITTKDDIY
jgi:hypothetical protein